MWGIRAWRLWRGFRASKVGGARKWRQKRRLFSSRLDLKTTLTFDPRKLLLFFGSEKVDVSELLGSVGSFRCWPNREVEPSCITITCQRNKQQTNMIRGILASNDFRSKQVLVINFKYQFCVPPGIKPLVLPKVDIDCLVRFLILFTSICIYMLYLYNISQNVESFLSRDLHILKNQ